MISRAIRIALIGVGILLLGGIAMTYITRSRVESDRVRCQNHLRELGLIAVRHASPPGQSLPAVPRDELPPGTFLNPALTAAQRMSWYLYLLNALNDGVQTPDASHRKPAGLTELMAGIAISEPWDAAANLPLAKFRLNVAICPAQFRTQTEGSYPTTNYVANGGIGLDAPSLKPDLAGKRAGAYYYDGPTPDASITDGLRQTAQFLETNHDLAPWSQGGPGSLQALDPATAPYLGVGRPFGGCHPGGMYASMADGSVRFVNNTIDPGIFQAMLTRAGGSNEMGIDTP